MIARIKKLSPTGFENLTYDTLTQLGLENAVWRTPGRDGGRDIEGTFFAADLSGYKQAQKWYIECKKYTAAVDWPTVREKLSYAESHAADFLLFVITSTVSPQAMDEVNRWNELHHRPRVRVWNGHQLIQILERLPAIQIKYGLSQDPAANAAVSLLPLSTMMLKFTQAAYSEEVFRNTETRALEAAASLADLSTRRFEQIENSESWGADRTRQDDLFSWIDVADPAKLESLDRYFLRAFLATYKSMVAAEHVALRDGTDGAVAVTTNGKRELISGQRNDLLVIAQWGDCEISFEPSGLQIRTRMTHAA